MDILLTRYAPSYISSFCVADSCVFSSLVEERDPISSQKAKPGDWDIEKAVQIF